MTRTTSRLTCPICQQPKTHYRLYGYRCHNAEHAEIELEVSGRILAAVLRGVIPQADFDAWCAGEIEPDSIAEYWRPYRV